MITINKRQQLLFTSFHNTTQFMPKTDPNSAYKLRRVRVDKDSISCTDGHAWCRAELDHGLDVGLYEVVKKSKTEIVLHLSETDFDLFPPNDIVLGFFKPETFWRDLASFNPDFPDENYATIIRALENSFIAHEYWVKVAPLATRFSVDAEKPDNYPVLFRDRDEIYKMVIMPIRSGYKK